MYDEPVRPPTQLVVEDHLVRSRGADLADLTQAQLFAVLILWEADDVGPDTDAAPSPWIGWLTTTSHRSAYFRAADLDSERFRRWLAALPSWDHARLKICR